MLNIKVWTATLAAWMGVSFTLCALGGVLVPGLPIRHQWTWCGKKNPLAVILLGIAQNSKSKENWIWRAPVPSTGCLNPGIGVKPEPNPGLIWETFVLLNKLKNSATTSRCFTLPNGKYFRTRKSIVASAGVFREFLPRPSGRAERGKA